MNKIFLIFVSLITLNLYSNKNDINSPKSDVSTLFELGNKPSDVGVVLEKKCTNCGEIKLTSEFFKNKRLIFGVHSQCKKCEKKRKYFLINLHELNKNQLHIDISTDALKLCTKCNVEKQLSEFHKTKFNKSGFLSTCKLCFKIKSKKYREVNPEKKYLSDKKWREKNQERVNISRKKWSKNNHDKVLKNNKNQLKRRSDNPENYRIWRKNNPEKHKNYRKNYAVKKKTDTLYRIKIKLRKRFKNAMEAIGLKKNKNTTELLGCDLSFFKSHIESLFTEGMCWDFISINKIHIDHKIPCDAFNLSLISAQKTCFHYTNLQPLWAKDNLKKSNYISAEIINELKLKGILNDKFNK